MSVPGLSQKYHCPRRWGQQDLNQVCGTLDGTVELDCGLALDRTGVGLRWLRMELRGEKSLQVVRAVTGEVLVVKLLGVEPDATFGAGEGLWPYVGAALHVPLQRTGVRKKLFTNPTAKQVCLQVFLQKIRILKAAITN